jgi:hypothetical protein
VSDMASFLSSRGGVGKVRSMPGCSGSCSRSSSVYALVLPSDPLSSSSPGVAEDSLCARSPPRHSLRAFLGWRSRRLIARRLVGALSSLDSEPARERLKEPWDRLSGLSARPESARDRSHVSDKVPLSWSVVESGSGTVICIPGASM